MTRRRSVPGSNEILRRSCARGSSIWDRRIDQLVRNHKMARRGNTADEPLNVLLLAEWDAAVAKGPVTRTEFAKGFYKRYRQQSVRAVEKRLTRLLEARERKVEQERKLRAALQRPSLLNEGTE